MYQEIEIIIQQASDLIKISMNTRNWVNSTQDLESPCECDLLPLGSISHGVSYYCSLCREEQGTFCHQMLGRLWRHFRAIRVWRRYFSHFLLMGTEGIMVYQQLGKYTIGEQPITDRVLLELKLHQLRIPRPVSQGCMRKGSLGKCLDLEVIKNESG